MKKSKHLNSKQLVFLNTQNRMYELENLNNTHMSYIQVLEKDFEKENKFEEYFEILKRDVLMVIRLHNEGHIMEYKELNARLVLLIAFQLMAEELLKKLTNKDE